MTENNSLKVIVEIARGIRDLRQVPSGHLYARLMNVLTIDQYYTVLYILVENDLIEVDGSDLITWIGPMD